MLKTNSDLAYSRQICALGAKNLDSATELKTVAGDNRRNPRPKKIDTLPDAVRGLLVEFMAYLERNGFHEETTYPTILTHLAGDGANLLDPENVKMIIAHQKKKDGAPWSDSMKLMACCAYDAFCQMPVHKIAWERPHYTQSEITIMAPDEKDLDALINAVPSKRMATFLLCLKETFADPSEIIRCEWTDLNGRILSINHPVKHHYSGKYELSLRLVSMINSLKRKDKRIFATNYRSLVVSYTHLRKKLADRTGNPALIQISFKSFRHWGGSMLAYVLTAMFLKWQRFCVTSPGKALKDTRTLSLLSKTRISTLQARQHWRTYWRWERQAGKNTTK